jgi:hypothetical protein
MTATKGQVAVCDGVTLAVSTGDRKAEGKVDLSVFVRRIP